MEKYKIVTDSTADLPAHVYEEMEIQVVPMEFIMNEKTYCHYGDAREMGFQEFYSRLKSGETSSTTQINYFTYESIFRPILEAGEDIIYIAFSSALSGTYQASKIVIEDLLEKFPERRIEVIDSLSASIGEGVLVYRAAKERQKGRSFEEVKEWTAANCLHACHWFVVEDLNHLKRGGRVTAMQATVGTALNLKPMLSVDNSGKLISVSKIRGTRKIVDAFITRFESDAYEKGEQTVVVGHADNIKLAEKLKEKLKESELVGDVIISDIGPVIGSHVGAGMTALAFIGDRNY